MTTDREILENYRNDLEHRIKDLFIWALGEPVITEMTRTVRDNDPNRLYSNGHINQHKSTKGHKSTVLIIPVTLHTGTKQIP